LVIAPHSDDEVFGCAGTMAKVKALGGEVFVVVVSVGDLVHYVEDGQTKVQGQTRIDELRGAMTFLGVDDWEVLITDPEKHLRLDAVPRRDLIALFERDGRLSIDRIRPTMVALPATSYNQDHEAVFKAGFTACRPHLPQSKPFQSTVVSYDNPAISWSLEREKFHPNFYVDISDFLETKMKAVGFHQSQIKPRIHHASLENVEWLARVRGREISVEAAEAFMCHRFVS
jgi:LmbE family N-acetylglucosaminyl deacetylase